MTDVVRLLAVRELPLSIDEVFGAIADPAAGGHVVFVGSVRNSDGAVGAEPKAVTDLGYSAHPSAEDAMHAVAARVVHAHPVIALAAVHRVGNLAVGDLAVVVGVSCAHRGEAFAAARQLIDEIKAEVPIWKSQRFADGSDEWVGLP